MTKRFILFHFAFLVSALCVSQTYQPFPGAIAMWREDSGGYQCSCCSDYQYIITGDTLIGATVYHKIEHSGVQYQEDMAGFCTSTIISYFDYYKGALREDTLSKKIFFRAPGGLLDTLLYAFDLNLGDTLPPSINNTTFPDPANWVSGVDSILIGGVYHKQFFISGDTSLPGQLNYTSIIEGMGSTFGLFSKLIAPFESNYSLLCFTVNGSVQYPNGGTSCLPVTSGILNNEILTGLTIYPNPATDILFLDYELNQTGAIEIENMLGERLYKRSIAGKEDDRNKKIDIGMLPGGIYFLKLMVGNKIQVEKFIKE